MINELTMQIYNDFISLWNKNKSIAMLQYQKISNKPPIYLKEQEIRGCLLNVIIKEHIGKPYMIIDYNDQNIVKELPADVKQVL